MKNIRAYVIYGPTGVGKTDLVLQLAQHMPAEIINMDVGQFYTPLAIGTAKPDWKNEPVPHHLFDILDEPGSCSVMEYRARVTKLIQEISERGNTPILVGGSGFYLRSLLFPPIDVPMDETVPWPQGASWQELHAIDPVRAQEIPPGDRYRIERAIHIYRSTNRKPSELKPTYNPVCESTIIHVTRDRQQLYERINARTDSMMREGWIEETRALLGTPWEPFLQEKKLIGYDEVLRYVRKPCAMQSHLLDTVELIRKTTRHYAKRQETLWRGLRAMVSRIASHCAPYMYEANLTQNDSALYIESLLKGATPSSVPKSSE